MVVIGGIALMLLFYVLFLRPASQEDIDELRRGNMWLYDEPWEFDGYDKETRKLYDEDERSK